MIVVGDAAGRAVLRRGRRAATALGPNGRLAVLWSGESVAGPVRGWTDAVLTGAWPTTSVASVSTKRRRLTQGGLARRIVVPAALAIVTAGTLGAAAGAQPVTTSAARAVTAAERLGDGAQATATGTAPGGSARTLFAGKKIRRSQRGGDGVTPSRLAARVLWTIRTSNGS